MAAWALVVERIVAGLRPQLARFMIGENVATVVPWTQLTGVDFERPPIVAMAALFVYVAAVVRPGRCLVHQAGRHRRVVVFRASMHGVETAGAGSATRCAPGLTVTVPLPALAWPSGDVTAGGSSRVQRQHRRSTSTGSSPTCSEPKARRSCASRASSSTIATRPKTSCRRPSSVSPGAPGASTIAPERPRICVRSCSTWPATTTVVASSRCATALPIVDGAGRRRRRARGA